MTSILNKKYCDIKRCDFSHIQHILKEYHYKGNSMGGGISVCFAMFYCGELVGGSVVGKPRHEGVYGNCLDIRRMACIDSSPKNSESWFLSKIIRWCASNTDCDKILSYSDTTVNHFGTIYKAANFKKQGETSPSKRIKMGNKYYHMRSLTIDRPYSFKIREALKTGLAEIETGSVKIVWIYNISQKLKRGNYFIDTISSPPQQIKLL